MPTNRVYPKALYEVTASQSSNPNIFILFIDYMTNYNENLDTYDSRIQIFKLFQNNNTTLTMQINTKSGVNDYCEVVCGNQQFSISQGEYVWYQGGGAIVDPSALQSTIYQVLGM